MKLTSCVRGINSVADDMSNWSRSGSVVIGVADYTNITKQQAWNIFSLPL
jgi:hypothetical protein